MGELLGAAAWAGKIYSRGWVEARGPTFASVEPATGRQLADVGSAAPDDVRRAVQRASDAQQAWAATPYDWRATVLRRAAELLVKHQDELEDWVVQEAGLPRYFAGALGAAEEFHQAAALASAPLGQVLPSVHPVVAFKDIDEAARLATETECGLSLAILTTDVMSGLELAERVPVGMVHINDQTSTDEPIAPFGGVGLSGNGYRIGGQQANLEAFTEMQWITINQEPGSYPF
jgi:acyl-CoA reductase-like NAD-dependent aldehyde dehydrogenase